MLNFVVVDTYCLCVLHFVVVDTYCSCMLNFVVVDTYCLCVLHFVVVDTYCSCMLHFVVDMVMIDNCHMVIAYYFNYHNSNPLYMVIVNCCSLIFYLNHMIDSLQ
jgi:hypothetical protein